MRRFISLVCIIILFSACNRQSRLVALAEKNLPVLVNTEMADYDHTVEQPVIEDLALLYDCDSLCILQCKASAKDAEGLLRRETIRYVFVLDTFMSRALGEPVYLHAVQGAPYLDEKGIKQFRDNLKADFNDKFIKYISISEPVRSE